MTDTEIARLLLMELEHHGEVLATGAPPEARRALHALKGSAALAGEEALAAALARVERRLAAGEPGALGDARALVGAARAALSEGRGFTAPAWPEPPPDLEPSAIDPGAAAIYAAETRDRVARMDAALAGGAGDRGAAADAFREVHAMKGAALAVGDQRAACFAHGLDERQRDGERSEADARRALDELARWRGLLLELVIDPARALEALRALARSRRRGSSPPRSPASEAPSARLTSEPPSEVEAPRGAAGEPSLRVPTAALDRLLERVRQIGQARVGVAEAAAFAQATSARARSARGGIADALRLIGPPRPWGAPAAAITRIESAARELAALADGLEREAGDLRELAEAIRHEAAAAHGELLATRTTKVAWLFDRVAAATSAQARREGREIRLLVSGTEAPIDRRVAEQLYDPVLQLARNAVTHGIEPAEERVRRGKPPAGAVHLSAEPRSGGLRLRVHDDGAGVDVAEIRRRAEGAGAISPEMARAADDATLLALLFVPGFTTRDSADLLAGRGVGLDLALEAVRRLGGTIRLASRPGAGLTATLDIPFERGLVTVLWIEAAG
ncbi:MAG: Hpt domain-containing protein, partial [Polyangiaceae bacterium]|nr:Hpt domain-containing protein [Polyangiaceae bacterium]